MSMSDFNVFFCHYQHFKEGRGSDFYEFALDHKAKKVGEVWVQLWHQFCDENPILIAQIFASETHFNQTIGPYLQALGFRDQGDHPSPPYTLEQIAGQKEPTAVAWAEAMEAQRLDLTRQHFGLLAQAALKLEAMGLDLSDYHLDLSSYAK